MDDHWTDNFITISANGQYEAWDETEAGSLGLFNTRDEAVAACIAHADTLAYLERTGSYEFLHQIHSFLDAQDMQLYRHELYTPQQPHHEY